MKMRSSTKEIAEEQIRKRNEQKLLFARIDETEKALRQAHADFATARDVIEKYTEKRIHEWPKYVSKQFVIPQNRIDKVLHRTKLGRSL